MRQGNKPSDEEPKVKISLQLDPVEIDESTPKPGLGRRSLGTARVKMGDKMTTASVLKRGNL